MSDIPAHQIEYGMLQYDIDVAEDKLKILLAKLKLKTDNSGRRKLSSWTLMACFARLAHTFQNMVEAV